MKKTAQGLLTPDTRPFRLNRYPVPADLTVFFEYFWSVEWALEKGERFESVNIPYPCAHIVFEKGQTGIFGPVKGSFTKELIGTGGVLGARFKTGHAVPYTRLKALDLIDQQRDLGEVFRASTEDLHSRLRENPDLDTRIQWMIDLLMTQLPNTQQHRLESARTVEQCCAHIEKQPSIKSVADLRDITGLHERKLERLFKEYIGLPPNWVIRLYRLQQLADQLIQNVPLNWADLALELGYFDQAHCIRDFKKFTGKTPTEFQ